MLMKEEIRGLVICVMIVICLLAIGYFVTIMRMNAWNAMVDDLSGRTVYVVKTYGPRLAKRLVSEFVESLRR